VSQFLVLKQQDPRPDWMTMCHRQQIFEVSPANFVEELFSWIKKDLTSCKSAPFNLNLAAFCSVQ
jgi:hypothetical protein